MGIPCGPMGDGAVLVTGASTGIGRACALRLDRDGWRVYAAVRRDADGEALRAVASSRLTPVLLDVTDADQVQQVASRLGDDLAGTGLRGLVNNAGVAIGGPVEFLPLERWQHQFDVNVFGQIRVTQALFPLLRQATGRIVFIGSNSGRVAAPLMGPYASSKFAIEGLADAMRLELHGSGIEVVVVEPGAVKTDIWGKGRTQVDEVAEVLPAEALERYGEVVAAIRHGIDQSEKGGVAPDAVAAVVAKALTSARPRTRYQVGVDAKVSVALARVLPGRLLDPLLRKAMRP